MNDEEDLELECDDFEDEDFELECDDELDEELDDEELDELDEDELDDGAAVVVVAGGPVNRIAPPAMRYEPTPAAFGAAEKVTARSMTCGPNETLIR